MALRGIQVRHFAKQKKICSIEERIYMDTKNILDIIKKHNKNKVSLISILEEIQGAYTYLPEKALRLLAKETGCSLTDIYGVATFYKAFSLKPKGKHCVSVCLGTACHVRGAQNIVEEFKRELSISPGETTPDNEITLETVNCLGACALGPTVVSDGQYFPHVSKSSVKEIITRTKGGGRSIAAEADIRIFPLQVSCPLCGKSLMDHDYIINGHPSVKFNVSMNGKKVWLRMSSLYGKHTVELENQLPPNELSRFHCPHCHNEFPSFSTCPECGASMAALFVREKCSWEVCMRQGCQGHILNLDQINLHKKSDKGKNK